MAKTAIGEIALGILLVLAWMGIRQHQKPQTPILVVWEEEHKPMEPSRVGLREVECLALNIYHEARGEPREGQVAVGYVTLNRLRAMRARWGKDVCEVVWKPHQFSWTKNPPPIKNLTAWEKSWEIALGVMENKLPNPIGPADHYHARRIQPRWAKKMVRVKTIGQHIFYN
jgi:spore germination cell wall hydrolase CwlJ-like protein